MSLKIRLARAGAKKRPFYRIVIADSRSPRDGRFIEVIGHYNPLTKPPTIKISTEKAEEWIKKGAQASNTVKHLLKHAAKAAKA